MRVLLRVAYDGSAYCGYQIQDNGDTIQEELEKALLDLFCVPIETTGGSRTDAGVHSLGNPVVFDVETKMKPMSIAPALNVRLPEDIRVLSSVEVASDFHPHTAPSRKTYEYCIRVQRMEVPTERNRVLTVHVPLDLAAMQKAAGYLEGEHDFTSFSSIHAQVTSKVRTIYSCQVTCDERDTIPTYNPLDPEEEGFGRLIRIRVTGNGFLYNMVRIIAGTLVEVGRGAMKAEEVEKVLAAMDRSKAGPTAPAKGLTMIRTEFVKL